jgi:hypothetical protein
MPSTATKRSIVAALFMLTSAVASAADKPQRIDFDQLSPELQEAFKPVFRTHEVSMTTFAFSSQSCIVFSVCPKPWMCASSPLSWPGIASRMSLGQPTYRSRSLSECLNLLLVGLPSGHVKPHHVSSPP